MKLIKLFVLALFIILAFLLTACSTTVPVSMKFPDTPDILLEKCPPLKTIDGDNVSIVDLTKITTLNYTAYYECAVKVESWIEWHKDQKKIFDKVTK